MLFLKKFIGGCGYNTYFGVFSTINFVSERAAASVRR